MENLTDSSFGELLKDLRRRQHLTQSQLATKLGVHRNTIGFWERGEFLPDTKSMVLELARHLDLSELETRQLLSASLTGLSPTWSVPYARNPFFTGREDLLEKLHERLMGKAVVALAQSYALSGLGGVGKTQLAVEYAYRYALSYSAVLWIGAESAETILSSFTEIAERLQLPERQDADQQQMVRAVQRWLSTHSQWLLIWDNIEDFALLQRFLPVTRQGAILITTQRLALGTLAEGVELSEFSPSEGLLFLLRRAKALRNQQQRGQGALQTSGEYQAAEQLVAEMGGLPLALDEAGAYIEETLCSLRNYLELFQTRQVQLLKRRGEMASSHPASVVATWSLSFERVERANPLAADLLRLCAFLHPDAIAEEILLQGITYLDKQPERLAFGRFQFHEVMRTVAAYSLLRSQGGERTYSMHRLVQAVLRNGMDEEERQQWMERAVHVVDAVLPEVEPAAWGQYEPLLPHMLICTNHQVQSEQSHLEMASLLFKTASYLLERFHHEEVESLFLRSLQIREQILADSHPDVARSLNGLAQLYCYQGQLEKVELLYQRAWHIFGQELTPKHPDLATLLNNLATLYTKQGNYAQAEALLQQALSILTQTWGYEHPNVARSLNNLAILHHVQGQIEQAEPLYQRAFSLWKHVSDAPRPDVVVPLHNLANLYRYQERFAEAEPLYRRVLSFWEQAFGPSHPSVIYALFNLITLYAQQGRSSEAEPLSQRALSVWETTHGYEHSLMAPELKTLQARGTSGFGHIVLTPEKHGQMLLLNPHALKRIADLAPQSDHSG